MQLTEAIDQIKEYQKKLGYDGTYETTEAQMAHIRDLSIALNVEVSEFLEWLPWKPWRPAEKQQFQKIPAAEELIDIFFFTVNLWLALGMDPTIFDAMFEAKLQENLNRIERGYSKVKEELPMG